MPRVPASPLAAAFAAPAPTARPTPRIARDAPARSPGTRRALGRPGTPSSPPGPTRPSPGRTPPGRSARTPPDPASRAACRRPRRRAGAQARFAVPSLSSLPPRSGEDEEDELDEPGRRGDRDAADDEHDGGHAEQLVEDRL